MESSFLKIVFIEIPADYLKICHRKDPKLNDCIRESIEGLRPKLAAGIEELLVPPCEPLSIPEISIRQNAGAIRMDSEYSNILVSGLTNFTLRSIRMDPETNKFRIKLWFPSLAMVSDYNIHGKLLLMPLAGSGTCKGNFSKLTSVQEASIINGTLHPQPTLMLLLRWKRTLRKSTKRTI